MSDQPAAPESSIESRLAAVLSSKPAPTGAAPAEEAPQQDPQPAAESPDVTPQQDAEQAPEGEAPAEDPNFEEIDWEDGNRYQVPKALKPALMKEADYRRKTMELAEIRKATEADRFQTQAAQAFQQQVAPLLQKRAELQSTKERARHIDWTQLTTDQKIDVDRELRNIDAQIGEIDAQIGNGYQQHQQTISQAVLHAVSATEQFMAHKVPGWNQETGAALHNYGLQLGIPKSRLITGWFADPVATATLWKAAQWDSLQAGKPQVQNRAASAPPVIKPNGSAVQQSQQQSKFREARSRLKKTGSLQDAAAVFLRMK